MIRGEKENGSEFIKQRWAEWEKKKGYWKLIGKGKDKETELNWKTHCQVVGPLFVSFNILTLKGFFVLFCFLSPFFFFFFLFLIHKEIDPSINPLKWFLTRILFSAINTIQASCFQGFGNTGYILIA